MTKRLFPILGGGIAGLLILGAVTWKVQPSAPDATRALNAVSALPDVHREPLRERVDAMMKNGIDPDSWLDMVSAASRKLSLNPVELYYLEPRELDLSPPNDAHVLQVYRESRFEQEHLVNDTAPLRYFSVQDLDIETLPVVAPAPAIISPAPNSVVDNLYPTVKLKPLQTKSGERVQYYFEFDTIPTFKSPNAWRTPTLLNSQPLNPNNRNDVVYYAYISRTIDVHADSPEVRFPFRASAMMLPDTWGELSFVQLEYLSRTVGHQLRGTDLVNEVYNYIHHLYPWATNSEYRRPIEVFMGGIGSCSLTNSLAQYMMEVNGLKTRIVGGFNPVVRHSKPGGGHAAVEVYLPEQKTWAVVDPYFDILSLKRSMRDIAEDNQSFAHDVRAYDVSAPEAVSAVGSAATYGDLFRYRRYGDHFSRVNPTPMSKIAGREKEFARDWPAVTAPTTPSVEELLPDEIEIHVRARALIFAAGSVVHFSELPLDEIKIVGRTPWSTGSFRVPVKSLMRNVKDQAH